LTEAVQRFTANDASLNSLRGVMRLFPVPVLILLFAVTGCTSSRETIPQRSATEQLLISTAADHAVEEIDLNIPRGAKVFVDATNFEGTDSKYAIGALRDRILRLGGHLVSERVLADTIVEIRSGALSVDQSQTLVGIPQFDVPIPLAGPLGFPEIALFKKSERRGVAKFAATSYGVKEGEAQDSTGPRYGFSHDTHWVLLFFFSWGSGDVLPEENKERPLQNLETPDFTP
jgi:hypothetical protein